VIHLVCGSTGAGKTTYANELRQQLGALHLSIDDWMVTLFAPDTPPQMSWPWIEERVLRCERQILATALDLARTTVRAPVDGVVVNMRLQQGEQVKAATPLFSLVVLSRPWVEANFKETELTHVKVGQKATVVLDTYPDVTWEALVESVSPATGAEFAILPPQNASGNWVKVVQRLPVKLRLLPHVGEPPLRAGMTATVKIDTGRQRDFTSLLGGTTDAAPAPASPPHDVTAESK